MHIIRDDRLPALAWLLTTVEPASIICGRSVLAFDDGIFEGTWSGPLDSRFETAANVFGSGVKFTKDGWMVIPPSHTLECLYLLQSEDGMWSTSNSLAFLLTATGAKIQLSGRRLCETMVSIVKGLDCSPITIPTDRGRLYLLYHHNALLFPNLKLVPKPLPPAFCDFSSYQQYLEAALYAAAANAQASSRPQCYNLLATLSSGYDSPACAAVAMKAGCSQALTFRSGRGGDSDDGTAIAAALGLRVTCVDRPSAAGGNLAEFLATGMQGEDSVYSACADLLGGRLLVTGFHGDRIWCKHMHSSDAIKRGDVSGASLGEFRLRVDFIHLPLPFVGAQRHADVRRIANSNALAPYSVGGRYDRPVARKLAEDAGVARNSFGQSKKAISLLLFVRVSFISKHIRQAIWQVSSRPRISYALDALRYQCGRQLFRLIHKLRSLNLSIFTHAPERLLRHPFPIYVHSHPFLAEAFFWAQKIVSARYRTWAGFANRSRQTDTATSPPPAVPFTSCGLKP